MRAAGIGRRRSSGWGGAFLLGLGVLLGPQIATPQEEGSGEAELEALVEMRVEANDEKAATQQRIVEISDETNELLTEYRVALKQIDAIEIYNDQMEDLIASQLVERASLSDQLDRVEIVGRSVTPLMLRMIDALEAFAELDIPFLLDERLDRVRQLSGLMKRSDVSNSEKYRQIMEAYQIENEYGRTIEAYRSTLKRGDQEVTVDFLRFGRIALVYQTIDESEAGVWDKTTRSWLPLDTSYRSAIRNGLRIARKQTAPDLVQLPLPAPERVESAGATGS